MVVYDFTVPVYGIGDLSDCLFSYFCCPIALAQSRTQLDSSPFCFNIMCLNCVAGRWMIRTAYGIPGSPVDDVLKAVFMPCCSVNQLYQTTKRFGNPSTYGGRPFNQDKFRSDMKKDAAYNCIISAFCNSCAVGSALETSLGMPFCMGCLCVNPFAARNMFRYHMRIKGEDALEMIVPTTCIAMDQFVTLPPYGFINFYMMGAMFATMQLLAEVEARGAENIVAKRYLTGYRVEGDDDDHENVHYEDAMGRSLTASASAPLQEVELMVPKRGEVIVPSAILSESAAVRVTEPKR